LNIENKSWMTGENVDVLMDTVIITL